MMISGTIVVREGSRMVGCSGVPLLAEEENHLTYGLRNSEVSIKRTIYGRSSHSSSTSSTGIDQWSSNRITHQGTGTGSHNKPYVTGALRLSSGQPSHQI